MQAPDEDVADGAGCVELPVAGGFGEEGGAVVAGGLGAVRAGPPGSVRICPARSGSEQPAEADEPTGYWMTNSPATTPIADLVRWAKMRRH